jgi:hypothetical protein
MGQDEDYTAECGNFHFLELHLPIFLSRERREHAVFKALLSLVPNMEERIMTGSKDDLTEIADLASFIAILYLPHSNYNCLII